MICSSFISHLSSQRTLPPPTGTPSTLEGEFLYSSSPKLGEVSRSDGGVCLSFISHLSSLISHLSSSPAISVERAITYGLRYVVRSNIGCTLQVGNRACHLDYAVIGSGRELQSLHSSIEQRACLS